MVKINVCDSGWECGCGSMCGCYCVCFESKEDVLLLIKNGRSPYFTPTHPDERVLTLLVN